MKNTQILLEDILQDITDIKRCGIANLNEKEMERFINDIEIKVKQVLEEVNK